MIDNFDETYSIIDEWQDLKDLIDQNLFSPFIPQPRYWKIGDRTTLQLPEGPLDATLTRIKFGLALLQADLGRSFLLPLADLGQAYEPPAITFESTRYSMTMTNPRPFAILTPCE